MDLTTSAPTQGAFATAVATQRTRLQRAYVESDYLPHAGYDLPDERLRVSTPAFARFVYESSVGHLVGFVLAAGLVIAGWRCDHLYVTGDNDGLALTLALVAGAAAWACVQAAFRRTLRPYLVDLTGFSQSLYCDIGIALAEIRRDHSDVGVRLQRAADRVLPGLETLAEEDHRLATTAAANRYAPHRSDYRTALLEARKDVDSLMLDVAAELIAAASVVFAARDDLLVELADVPTVDDVVLRDSLLNDQVRAALTEARTALREAATGSR